MSDDTRTSPATAIERAATQANPAMEYANPLATILSALACLLGLLLLGACNSEDTVGQPVEIKWMYSYTKKQYDEGLREEDYSTTVIVPPPTVPEAEYLEVHFYPDHHVELALVKFPGDRRIPYEEKDE